MTDMEGRDEKPCSVEHSGLETSSHGVIIAAGCTRGEESQPGGSPGYTWLRAETEKSTRFKQENRFVATAARRRPSAARW